MRSPESLSDARVADVGLRAQPLQRRSTGAGLALLLTGAGIAASLLFLSMFRLTGTAVLHEAGALGSSLARLNWAASAPGSFDTARGEVDATLVRLKRAAADAKVTLADLPGFESRWAALRRQMAGPAATEGNADTLPASPVLRSLASSADTMAAAARQQIDDRHQQLELWLKVLTLLFALTLLLPIHGLWRQRQQVRASLLAFSDQLDDGEWQDAVRTLRDDRLGPPSAFDALASGVEGVMVETERRWQALADLSADWYWESDALHRLSRLSGRSPSVSKQGWAQADLLGRRRDQIEFYEAPVHGWAAWHQRMDRHQSVRDIEFRIQSRLGNTPIWVSISGRARMDARGEFVGYEGVGRDITERKSVHEKLMASEQRWSLMAGLASDWYWQTDSEHRMLPLSPELYRRFSQVADRVEGRTRWEAHRDALSAAQWAEHRADLDARRPFRSLLIEFESANGSYLWMSISGIPRFDGQGQFVGYHGVGRDVTLRKQAETLLRHHNEELQRAVQERTRELEQVNLDLDAFSRQLAHELRTPIGHVQGLAHLIESRVGDRLNPDERQLLALQVQAAHSMRDTVDALLQLARSTMLAMPMAPLDVSTLACAVAAELPALRRQGDVVWVIQPGLHAVASAPALRIVLVNLLANAAKFTRQQATPVVRVSGSTDPDGRQRICIEDNGIGFDPALVGRLFTPFSRLHSGDEFQGTGIGLTIVQRIVERHGGRVSASAGPGLGARFEFTLAAVPADRAAPA